LACLKSAIRASVKEGEKEEGEVFSKESYGKKGGTEGGGGPETNSEGTAQVHPIGFILYKSTAKGKRAKKRGRERTANREIQASNNHATFYYFAT